MCPGRQVLGISTLERLGTLNGRCQVFGGCEKPKCTSTGWAGAEPADWSRWVLTRPIRWVQVKALRWERKDNHGDSSSTC